MNEQTPRDQNKPEFPQKKTEITSPKDQVQANNSAKIKMPHRLTPIGVRLTSHNSNLDVSDIQIDPSINYQSSLKSRDWSQYLVFSNKNLRIGLLR